MGTEENKAVIRAFTEDVINQGRLERADDLVVQDFIEHDPLPGQRQGREGLTEIIAVIRSAFPDIHWGNGGDGGRRRDGLQQVHLVGQLTGGIFLGIPATGRRVKISGMVLDRVVAGRMAESRILMDKLQLMQQLGVISSPKE